MCAEVSHAGDAAQLFGGTDRDPVHRLDRRAGLLDEVHQEVGFAEIGQELVLEPGIADACQQQAARDDPHCQRRPRHHPRQHPGVAAF